MVIVMSRTFQQLADELTSVYGPMATSVCQCYVTHNPLKTDKPEIYWENVRIFLHELHTILYTQDNKLNIEVIATEAYFFLCKMCVDRSFTVSDLIDIRNDRTVKHNKNIANDLSHNVLPQYITMRRQFDYQGIIPSLSPGMVAMPPMQPMMGHMPYMQYPGMGMPPQMPMSMSMPIPVPNPVPPAPAQGTGIIRTRPRILRRINALPLKKQETDGANREVTIPIHNLKDGLPLDFYTVHRCDTDGTMPQVTPVPNHPPPPSP